MFGSFQASFTAALAFDCTSVWQVESFCPHFIDEEIEVQGGEQSQHSQGNASLTMTARRGVEAALLTLKRWEAGFLSSNLNTTPPANPAPPPSALLSCGCQSLSEKPKPQALLGLWPQPSK